MTSPCNCAGSATSRARDSSRVDRGGREIGQLGELADYATPRLSPDGDRLAVVITDDETDLWIFDLERGVPSRFTSSRAGECRPTGGSSSTGRNRAARDRTEAIGSHVISSLDTRVQS